MCVCVCVCMCVCVYVYVWVCMCVLHSYTENILYISCSNNDLSAVELLEDGGHNPVLSVQDLIRTLINANEHVTRSLVAIRYTSLYPEFWPRRLYISRSEN